MTHIWIVSKQNYPTATASTAFRDFPWRRACATDEELISCLKENASKGPLEVEYVEIQKPLSDEEIGERAAQTVLKRKPKPEAVPLSRSGDTE